MSTAGAASEIETSRLKLFAAAGGIVLAALAAYANSFQVPFIFDDRAAILENSSLRRLWPIWEAFMVPAPDLTVSGRPIANFSFALNYAVSGTEVWSYHVLNLLIHVAGGLTLFGIVRRTLLQPVLRVRFGTHAWPLAWVVALLWTLHPVQTEAVTYTVQRVESLMSLFYLLTLYGFIRAVDSPRPGPWPAVMFTACLLGMGTKEVMVSAPVLVFLYDRTFVAGTFAAAWRRHARYYVGLGSTWLLLLIAVGSTGWNRGGVTGFDVRITAVDYWLTQFQAVTLYLRLALWPHPLIFEYGTFLAGNLREIVPGAIVVVTLVGATLWALRRRPVLGFVGAWFFAILAPTSVVPSTVQMIVEHRMYLALPALLVLAVPGLWLALRRRSWVLFGGWVLVLGVLAAQRNKDYRSELDLWLHTVAKRPGNPAAHSNLGTALFEAGRLEEARASLQRAVELRPQLIKAHLNLGLVFDQLGRYPESMQSFAAALRYEPEYAEAHYNLGNVLMRADRISEAIQHFTAALRIKPDLAEAHVNLGAALDRTGRLPEAIEHYRTALRLRPDDPKAHCGLGAALDQTGRTAEAIRELETAVRLDPDLAAAHYYLGNARAKTGNQTAAVAHYQTVLRLEPTHPEANYNMGNTMMQAGRTGEAITYYESALRMKPAYVEAHNNLGVALAQTGRVGEAIRHFEEVLRLNPDYPGVRENLAHARALLSRAGAAR